MSFGAIRCNQHGRETGTIKCDPKHSGTAIKRNQASHSGAIRCHQEARTRMISSSHMRRPSGYSLTAFTTYDPGVASCTCTSVNMSSRQSDKACSRPIALTKTKGATAAPAWWCTCVVIRGQQRRTQEHSRALMLQSGAIGRNRAQSGAIRCDPAVPTLLYCSIRCNQGH